MSKTTFPYDFPGVFDLDGSNPQLPFTFPTVFGLVKARLDVTATFTAAMGEAPQIRFETTVDAVATAEASVSTAGAVDELAVTATITAEALRDATAESSLTVTATPTGEAFETDPGEGTLAVEATPTADASAGYPFAAEFAAESTASAEVFRDATATSNLDAYAVPAVFAVNSTTSTADAEISASATTEALRDANATSSFTVTAELTGEALETGRGEGFLSITAAADADASVDYPFSAELAIDAVPSSDAHRVANADSSLELSLISSKPFPFYFPFVLGEQLTEALRDARVEADLAVQVYITQNISQNIVAYLAILAEGSGTGYLYAPVDGVDTSITAGISAVGTNTSPAQSSTDITSDPSSSAFKDARVEADLSVQCSMSAEIRNDAVVGSSFDVLFDGYAIGVENDAAASESFFTASPSSDADRDAAALSSIAFTADASSDFLRETFAAASTSVSASSSGVIAVPLQISELADYFNSKDEAKWVFGAGASVADGALVLPCGSAESRVESLYSAAVGSPWWKFTDGGVINVQLAQTPNAGNGTPVTAFQLVEVGCGLGRIEVAWQNGDWKFRQMDGAGQWGTTTVVPFTTAGSWIRLRRESGAILWDTSPDGITWTVRKSESLQGSYVGCSVSMWSEAGTESSPGEARWDNFNVIPVEIAAALTIDHSSSGAGTSEKYAQSYFVVDVDTSQDASNNANATGSLAAYLSTDQYLMKTLNGSASLDVWTLFDSRGTEYNPVDVDFAATIEGSAELSRGQDIDAEFGIMFGADPDLQRGQSVGSPFVSVEFSFDASALNNASAHSSLGAYAATDSDSLRIQYLTAELAATVETFVDSVETLYGTTSTDIAAQLTAGMSRSQDISADFAAQVSAFSTAVRVFFAGASLDVTAFATGQVEEPREVAYVEADDRTASVPAGVRGASVKVDVRLCSVPEDVSRAVLVVEDIRVAVTGPDSSRVSPVKSENRLIPVPAEQFAATI